MFWIVILSLYVTDLSAGKKEKSQDPWLPKTYEHSRRQACFGQEKSKGKAQANSLNSKSEYLNSKQYLNLKFETFRILSIWILDLFRASCLVLRI